MLTIGLTGGIASGKTTVSDLFAQKGIAIIDADIIAHELTRKGEQALAEIAAHWNDILFDNGELNRPLLRQRIFSSTQERLWLEGLLHHRILQRMQDQIAALPSAPYCIASIPLLVEVKAHSFIDRILVVDTSPEHQLARLTQRDHIDPAQAQAMLKAQASRDERLAMADDVITNNGTLKELEEQVDRMHEKYLRLASSSE